MKKSLPENQRLFWIHALVLMLVLAGCSSNKHEIIAPGSKVLVIGDSITAGYGLAPDQAWTARLASGTGWQVINAGVSGDTTRGGIDRLPALLDDHLPVAVIIELGGNDMLRRHSIATISSNLEAMIDLIEARRMRPVLMAIPQPSVAGVIFSSLSDASFYAEIARKKRIPLIDGALAKALSNAALKLDDLHPNSAGHEQIGADTVSKLRQLGLAP